MRNEREEQVLSEYANTYRTRSYESKSIAGCWWRVDAYRGFYVCNCRGVRAAVNGVCEHMRTEQARDQWFEEKAKVMPEVTGQAVALRDNTPQELAAIPTVTPSFLPSRDQYEMMVRIATLAVEGANTGKDNERALPVWIKTPQQAMTVMLAGAEMGFTPFAAMRQLFMVNGRLELYTQGLISLVKARDKTAKFVFERYERDGCVVAFYRAGEFVIRVGYDASDRLISKQGYTKRGSWKTSSGDKRYFDAAKDADGKIVYDPDPESPWDRYGRDMYAYNAVKRCVRLGAPDLVNIAPIYYAELDASLDERRVIDAQATAAPQSELHKALTEGTVDASTALGDDTPDDDEPPASRTQEQAPSTQPPAPADNAPADPRQIAAFEALMIKTRTEYGAEYVAWYRPFMAKQLPGVAAWDSSKLTTSIVREGLKELRGLRGEAQPEEVAAMTTERKEPQSGEQAKEPEPEPEPEREPGGGDIVVNVGENAGAEQTEPPTNPADGNASGSAEPPADSGPPA